MKKIFKIAIYILIITLILHKIYNGRILANTNKTQHTILVTSTPRNCQFESSNYIYVLPDCSRYKPGSVLSVDTSSRGKISRDDTISDTGFFVKKRLIIESISVDQNIWLSPEVWLGYLTLKFQGRKEAMIESFLSLIETESGYLIGKLSLGSSQVTSERVDHLFKVTGMQYLASISGYHLNLIVGFFVGSTKKFTGKKSVGVVALLISGFYLLFVGPKLPLARAFLMLFLSVISSSFLLRQTNSIYSLFWVGLVLTYTDISIISTVSFQLSFVATASIILFTKNLKTSKLANLHMSNFSNHTDEKNYISSIITNISIYIIESIKISIYVQVALVPLVLYHFKEFSLISLIVSVALTWLVPGLIILGLVSFFIGLLEGNGLITEYFILPLTFLSKLFLSILKLFDNEIFIVKVSDLAWWHVLIWWFLVFLALKIFSRKKQAFSLVESLKIGPKSLR